MRSKLLKHFVGLVDVAVVEFQMFFDGFLRDAVEFQNFGTKVLGSKSHVRCCFFFLFAMAIFGAGS